MQKKQMRLQGQTFDVQIATGFLDRLVGLMFKEGIASPYAGLVIEKCNSIHTCFMKFSIDVYYLDRANIVLRVCRGLRPWRLGPMVFRAVKVLETEAGRLSLKEGDKLEEVCIS